MSLIAKQRLLIAIVVAALASLLLAPRIAQDPLYHQFADRRALFMIPNALNVLTNLVFAWVGLRGLQLIRRGSLELYPSLSAAYYTFFGALVLIAAGSWYYHWTPDNTGLVVDRLPISFAMMSFVAIIVGERVSADFARRALPWLLLAGAASSLYWYASELAGSGDLRAYLAIQVLPMLIAPVILLAFDSRYTRTADLWWLLGCYIVARLCEVYDYELYRLLGFISGHSLKHLAAGAGSLILLHHLCRRRPVNR